MAPGGLTVETEAGFLQTARDVFITESTEPAHLRSDHNEVVSLLAR